MPLQVALIPLLLMYVNGAHWTIPWLDKTITVFPDLNLAGTTAIWLTTPRSRCRSRSSRLHLALPKDIFESARIDGANHFHLLAPRAPLSVPVLAAAIFQFLWTWNDYLIAVTMLGANEAAAPSTVVIAAQTGQFGQFEHAHRRRVPPGRGAAGRVLPPPAVLRPRHPRGSVKADAQDNSGPDGLLGVGVEEVEVLGRHADLDVLVDAGA